MGDVLTVDEVARLLKLSPKRVRQLPIPQIRLGPRTIRYAKEDVDRYLERRRLVA
jgi:excisionase family DNA binding protein